MSVTRSFVDLFSNNSVIRGLSDESAFKQLLQDGLYPADCLPQFLHESTHHWCFQSPVCVALAFLRLQALREGLLAREESRDVKWARECLSRYTIAETLLRPIAEGIALFAEFDVMPDHDSPVVSNPTHNAAAFFGGKKAFFDNDATTGFHRVFLKLRTSSKLVDRKATVLTSPLNVKGDGYLAGYLAMKTLWWDCTRSYHRFADSELFFLFIRAYLFADFELAAMLLDRTTEGEAAATAIAKHIEMRLYTVHRLKFDDSIPAFEAAMLHKPESVETDNFSEPTPWDTKEASARGQIALAEELASLRKAQNGDRDYAIQKFTEQIIARRNMMNVGMLEVELGHTNGKLWVIHQDTLVATAEEKPGKVPPVGKGYLDLILVPSFHFHVAAITHNAEIISLTIHGRPPEPMVEHLPHLIKSFSQSWKSVEMVDDAIKGLEPQLGVDWKALREYATDHANAIYSNIILSGTKDQRAVQEKMWESGFWGLFESAPEAVDLLARLSCWCSLRPNDEFLGRMADYHGFDVTDAMKTLYALQDQCGYQFVLSPPGTHPTFLA